MGNFYLIVIVVVPSDHLTNEVGLPDNLFRLYEFVIFLRCQLYVALFGVNSKEYKNKCL